LKIKALQNSVL